MTSHYDCLIKVHKKGTELLSQCDRETLMFGNVLAPLILYSQHIYTANSLFIPTRIYDSTLPTSSTTSNRISSSSGNFKAHKARKFSQ